MAKVVVKIPRQTESAPAPKPKARSGLRFVPVALVITVAALVRFAGLGLPKEVIFDEVHYGKHTSAYCCTHSNIFDLHPPHPKLIIASALWLAGYDGKFEFTKIGIPYENTLPSVAFRIFPAIAGVVASFALFWALQLLGVSTLLSVLGGFLLAIDNAFIVQTRAALLDGFLVAGELMALALYLKARRERTFGRYAIVAGMFAGLAVGTKFTGAFIIAMIGIHMLYSLRAKLMSPKLFFKYAAHLVAGFLIVYLAGFWFHFQALTLPGWGDKFVKPTGSFVADTIALHKRMYTANYNLANKHQDASPWFTWPMMKVPPFYWSKGERVIYLVGNPVIWWGSCVLFLLTIFFIYQKREKQKIPEERLIHLKWFHLSMAFAILPFAGLGRIFFMYHYFTPLCLCLITGLYWWDARTRRVGFDLQRHRKVVAAVALCAVIAGIAISPATYGYLMSTAYNKKLIKLIRYGRSL